jgi:hypothetical protein
MEIAALEIARMSEEIDGLRTELAAEQERRLECEAHLESLAADLEDRVLEVEQDVREECYLEMEKRVQEEMRRWKATWAAEVDRSEEHLDKKLEILTRGISVEDEENKENANAGETVNGGLAEENERLRRDVEMLRGEIRSRSPSKRMPLRESRTVGDVGKEIERLRLSNESMGRVNSHGSPVKKVRKLTARKWDLMGEDELL